MNNLSKLAAGTVIAATAALGGASVALADGYVPRGKVVYERPSDWSGVYFGVSSGYQWNSTDVSILPAGPSVSMDHDSYMVGGFLGIQHQFGSIVLGVEGNLGMAFKNNTGTSPCPGGGTCGGRLDDVLTVGGRAGWAAGHWMPYVTGGYASARFTHEVFVGAALDNTMSTRNQGWYIGGGVDWIVSPGWIAGIEYRHYEFDANTGIAFTPAGAAVNFRSLDATADTLMARVSWKFGREVAAPLK
jgi:outer membrane immunogenic protein